MSDASFHNLINVSVIVERSVIRMLDSDASVNMSIEFQKEGAVHLLACSVDLMAPEYLFSF